MVSAGYMAKRVALKPEWLAADRVVDVYSVSGCVSKNFADYVTFWKHNGFWLFDSPKILIEAAREHGVDLTGSTLFFYEVYEQEFDGDQRRWVPFEPENAFITTNVVRPATATLMGYDIASFYARSSPECSPLSCNGLAAEIETNEHCLLASLEIARQSLEEDKFNGSEPGPYRVFAVYLVAWP
jgi:hypothetical protein